MTQYTVTGASAYVKTHTEHGLTSLLLYRGAPVPGDVDKATIEHLLTVGLIEAVPVVEPASGDDQPGPTAPRRGKPVTGQ